MEAALASIVIGVPIGLLALGIERLWLRRGV